MNAFGILMLPLMGFCALMAALDGYGVPAAAILVAFVVGSYDKATR